MCRSVFSRPLAVFAALIVVACSTTEPVAPAATQDIPTGREGLPVSTSELLGFNGPAVAALMADAVAQRSEALLLLRNGFLFKEDYFGSGIQDTPIYAMSASKSFVALAYGFLVADHTLTSLDEPVVKWIPTFAAVDPRKAKITIRMLLTQTSGLGPWRASIEPANDIEAYAIKSPLQFVPGTAWQYSNNGIDLLAALFPRIGGKPIDQVLNERLFRPLGIADINWLRDSRGVPYGAGEMQIRALDMAKVGETILDGGKWHGSQVIPSSWIDTVVAQSQPYEPRYGMLWWRDATALTVALTAEVLEQWRVAGIADSTLQKLAPLIGKRFAENDYRPALRALLTNAELTAANAVIGASDHLPIYRVLDVGPVNGYYAAGWLGQYLYIVPAKRLVAVRMRRALPADYATSTEANAFPDFFSDVFKVIP